MKGSSIRIIRPSFPVFVLAALLCASTLVVPAPLLVGEATAQSDADIEKAKKAFRSGKKLYGEEDFLGAAKKFFEAYEYSNRSELLFNVARSYRKAGKLKEAERYFQQYLNELPDADNADQVVETIIQIQEEMAAQMANVEVKASRTGVDIFVDQETEARCQSPCTISLLPGEHTLTARPQGASPITRTLNLQAEQQTSVQFDLPGLLDIRTDQRSGSVSVAGVGEYTLPLSQPINLKAGAHDVTVKGEGDAKWSGRIEVASGETTSILVPLEPASSAGGMSLYRTASFGLAGASLGFLIGGIVMGMQASDTHATLDSQQQALGGVNTDMVEQGRSEQSGANLMYTLSAISLAGGAGLFAWDLYGDSLMSDEQDIPATTKKANDAAQKGDDLLDVGKSTDGDESEAEDEAESADDAQTSDDDEMELF